MAITVTTSTRLDDLQKLALASDTNARLVGKRDGQGNILLYHSQNTDRGLRSRLTGRAAEKRAPAREAVQQALANTFPSTTATDATLCSVRRSRISEIRSRPESSALPRASCRPRSNMWRRRRTVSTWHAGTGFRQVSPRLLGPVPEGRPR